MNITSVLAAAAIAATYILNGAQAQTLSAGLVPAEFPPVSYQGRQYVDSRGCVFIRAGVDGNVTWVPRVTRSRKIICGFQPTFARQKTTVAPKTERAAAVVAVTPKPVPKTRKLTTSKRAAPKAPSVVAAAPGGQPACRGGNAISQQYVGRAGQNVRCGPQQGSYATYVRGDRHRGASGTYGTQVRATQMRVAPRHVYENQMASAPGISVPKGYQPAWDDDRLNSRRAHQTLAGKARMDQVWTKTLPRKLVVRRAGVAVIRTSAKRHSTNGGGQNR